MKKIVLCLAIGLLAVSVALAGPRLYETTLTGEAEVTADGVPNQGDLDGTGSATITLDKKAGEVCFEISVSDILLPATGAHIHVGAATTTGPVVVPLTPPGESGESSGCVSADSALIKDIRKNPEAYYVNVHNADFPGGAVRGQLSK